MRRSWLAAIAAVAILVIAVVAIWIVEDRRYVIASAEERTQSVARMIAAHGDAALSTAELIIASIDDAVADWDLQDEATARRLFGSLRDLAIRNAQNASVWIVDSNGVSRLSTWDYPSFPYDASGRRYYLSHLNGNDDTVIASDGTPGIVSGKERFTVSRAVRNEDGSLHAIIVVGIFSEAFDALYREAATWPSARAGLFVVEGGTLAKMRRDDRPSRAYVREIETRVRGADHGSFMVTEAGERRLVSWQQLGKMPSLYAASSQTVSATLAGWRGRSIAVSSIGACVVVLFAALGYASSRAADARQAAAVRELALREAHHRVKNSLQLISSMVRLHARAAESVPVKVALELVAGQVMAVADAHELLQQTASLEHFDVCALVDQLCKRLQTGHAKRIEFSGDDELIFDAKHGIPVGVIANELITNAIKHGKSRVWVSLIGNGTEYRLSVVDDGTGLPEGFSIDQQERFGLKTALVLARGLSGSLIASNTGNGGAMFQLIAPMPPTARSGAPLDGHGRAVTAGDGRSAQSRPIQPAASADVSAMDHDRPTSERDAPGSPAGA